MYFLWQITQECIFAAFHMPDWAWLVPRLAMWGWRETHNTAAFLKSMGLSSVVWSRVNPLVHRLLQDEHQRQERPDVITRVIMQNVLLPMVDQASLHALRQTSKRQRFLVDQSVCSHVQHMVQEWRQWSNTPVIVNEHSDDIGNHRDVRKLTLNWTLGRLVMLARVIERIHKDEFVARGRYTTMQNLFVHKLWAFDPVVPPAAFVEQRLREHRQRKCGQLVWQKDDFLRMRATLVSLPLVKLWSPLHVDWSWFLAWQQQLYDEPPLVWDTMADGSMSQLRLIAERRNQWMQDACWLLSGERHLHSNEHAWTYTRWFPTITHILWLLLACSVYVAAHQIVERWLLLVAAEWFAIATTVGFKLYDFGYGLGMYPLSMLCHVPFTLAVLCVPTIPRLRVDSWYTIPWAQHPWYSSIFAVHMCLYVWVANKLFTFQHDQRTHRAWTWWLILCAWALLQVYGCI